MSGLVKTLQMQCYDFSGLRGYFLSWRHVERHQSGSSIFDFKIKVTSFHDGCHYNSIMLTKGRKCISRLYFLEVNADDIFLYTKVQLKWHNDHCIQWCAFEPRFFIFFCILFLRVSQIFLKYFKVNLRNSFKSFFLWISWTAFHPFSDQSVYPII